VDRAQPLPRKAAFIALGLTLLTFLAFVPALRCGFIDFDDPDYVWHNQHVLNGLNAADLRWAWSTTHAGYWQPLSWLSLMLDATINGPDARGFHLTNILLHAFSAGVAFLVLFSMTRSMWRSALVAALYAVHPLRVESVAWIAERKDVLSNLFAWLTIGGYIAYARRPSPRRYLLVLTPFVLGLLAKPMIVTLPCLLLLLDYWPLRRSGVKRLISEKAPLFLLAVAAGVGALIDQQRIHASVTWTIFPLLPRLGAVLHGYGTYIWKMIWFIDLAPFYPLPMNMPPGRVCSIILSAITLAVITVLAVVQRRRRPWLIVGWLWFLGVLAPVSGIFQSGTQDWADRFSYLPSVGLLVMLVWSIPVATATASRWMRVGASVLSLACLCTATWIQIGYWRDTRTLFTRTLAITHDNWLAHDQIALCLYRDGDFPGAMDECRKSLRINPFDPVAHFNLGLALAKRGKDDLAIREYRAALAIRPDASDIVTSLGASLQHCGDLMGAYREFNRAIALAPLSETAHSDLGGLLGQIGMYDKAVAELRLAVRLSPGDRQARMKLATVTEMRDRAGKTSADAGH
jgi:protein O-mannosyl-transferase